MIEWRGFIGALFGALGLNALARRFPVKARLKVAGTDVSVPISSEPIPTDMIDMRLIRMEVDRWGRWHCEWWEKVDEVGYWIIDDYFGTGRLVNVTEWKPVVTRVLMKPRYTIFEIYLYNPGYTVGEIRSIQLLQGY